MAGRIAAVVLCLVPATALAQTVIPEEPKNSLALVGSGTFVNGSIEGEAFDRHLYLIGVRYGRLIAQNGVLTFSYTPEVVHHLSNGYRALENPGMDSQMVCVGYGLGK